MKACIRNTLLLCCLSLFSWESACADARVPHYYFWLGTPALSRADYEFALTRLVLESTVEEFGPYTLSLASTSLAGSDAAFNKMRSGAYHITISQIFYQRPDLIPEFFSIEKPTWMGLFGYRQLIVHKRNLAKFKELKSLADLRAFRAGQGDDWADLLHYDQNDLDVVKAISFENLFAMLSAGRFDYLPLSVAEAEESLAAFHQHYPDLVIVPGVFIHYDLPMHFYVPKVYPQLAKRIKKGMEIVQNNGQQRKLLERFSGEVLSRIEAPKAVFIELK